MNQANAPMIHWFQAWTKNSQMMTECAQRLMRGQFERNAQTMGEMVELIGSGSAIKVMEVQQRWLTGTMQGFSEETRCMMTNFQETVGGSLGRIHEMARETVEEFERRAEHS